MALHLTTTRDSIPSDAVVLSESDAVKYQWDVIRSWESRSDVWPFKYGFSVLGVFSGLSGLYINNHFRQRLRLGMYGRLSTYIPMVVIPSLFSCLLHQEMILSDIFLLKSCPVCIEMKAAAMQVAFSTVFPFITAPLATFNFALRYNTYKMPSIQEQPKEVFLLWKRLVKPIIRPLTYNIAFQAIAAMGFTYLEYSYYCKLQQKLNQLEKQVENELNINV